MGSKSKVSGRSKKEASKSHKSNKSSSSSGSPPVQCIHCTRANISDRTESCSSAGKGSGMARLSFTFEEKPRSSRHCSSKPTRSRSEDIYKKSHKPLPTGVHRVELFGHFTKVALEGHILWKDCKCEENEAGTSKNNNNDDDDKQE